MNAPELLQGGLPTGLPKDGRKAAPKRAPAQLPAARRRKAAAG